MSWGGLFVPGWRYMRADFEINVSDMRGIRACLFQTCAESAHVWIKALLRNFVLHVNETAIFYLQKKDWNFAITMASHVSRKP